MSLKRFGAYAVLMYFVLRPAEGKPLPQNQQPDAAATTRPRSSTDAIRKTVGFMRVTFVEGDQRKEIAGGSIGMKDLPDGIVDGAQINHHRGLNVAERDAKQN